MTTDMKPVKRQSGLGVDRTYRWETLFMSRMKDILSSHIQFMTTREESTLALTKGIYSHPMWKRLPARSHTRLSGYLEAMRDVTYRHHTHWRMFLDGQLRTSKEVDAIATKENYPPRPLPTCSCGAAFNHDKDCKRPPIFKGAWQRIESDKSRHVWNNAPSKVY